MSKTKTNSVLTIIYNFFVQWFFRCMCVVIKKGALIKYSISNDFLEGSNTNIQN